MEYRRLIFELGKEGRTAYMLPPCDVKEQDVGELIPPSFLRDELNLPQVSEVDVVRHYTSLSKLNYGVDTGFYPLGSCTMKYNPKINEAMAALPGFTGVHPLLDDDLVQGCLELMYNTERILCEVTGMDRISFQPAAGASGELAGLLIIKERLKDLGQEYRNKIIIPDSAHGTNPASAAIAGFDVVEVESDEDGGVDISRLGEILDDKVAGLMLTNPNTLGLFDKNIETISKMVHDAGGLLYYDGANANAILGITRPGDMGFDVVHLNLHKTFGTPHGGGGPGSGPVGVIGELAPYLPVPVVEYDNDKYYLNYDLPKSMGKVKAFFGNFGVVVKTYAYLLSLGPKGLKGVSHNAVLNANYMMEKLKEYYDLPYDRTCMHEFVLSAKHQKELGISALDIAKKLLDYGFHPPTIYFPLIVKESMMIEPTETEGKETLDQFIDALIEIARLAEGDPERILEAPVLTPVGRLDEVKAARELVLKWKP